MSISRLRFSATVLLQSEIMTTTRQNHGTRRVARRKFISTGIYTFVLTIGAILSIISTWRVYWDLGILSKSLGAEEEAIINLKLIAGSCWFLLVHTWR